MGVIVQLKKLFTNTQVFPKTKSNAVYDDDLGRLDTVIREGLTQMSDPLESVNTETDLRDADTVGGISADELAKKSDYNGIICVLVADKWVAQTDGTFKYTIFYPSLTGNEFFDVNLYDDGTATQEQIDAFNELVTRIDVNEGEVLIQSYTKPPVTFSIILRGMCTVDETVVANLSEVVDKVNALSNNMNVFNVVNEVVTITSSTDLAYTGVSVEIPKGAYYSITFEAMYENAQPQSISVNQSDSVANTGVLATAVQGYNHCSCTTSGYAENTITLFLWAKYTGATSNRVMAKGFYVTVGE